MDSIYWVLSRDCNQRCPHCYNNSEPGAPGLNLEEVSRCVENLPNPSLVSVGRIILSGGEVLVWPDLLFHTLRCLTDRYNDASQIWVQTNGDLLDAVMLQRLLDHGVRRLDVASMDKYHVKGTLQRRPVLEAMFRAHGMISADRDAQQLVGSSPNSELSYAFWGPRKTSGLVRSGHVVGPFKRGCPKRGQQTAFAAYGVVRNTFSTITNRAVK